MLSKGWRENMSSDQTGTICLPSVGQVRLAIRLYLASAYRGEASRCAMSLIPPEDSDLRRWLMDDRVERDPRNAPLEAVRSFALRLGNWRYPHMKLRLSRPPRDNIFLFAVDSHDGILRAPPGSADEPALRELKRENAAIAMTVYAAWESAGIATERTYLRMKIQEARQEQPASPPSPPPADRKPGGRTA